MKKSVLVAGAAVIAGCVLVLVAVIYVAEPARSLPTFFPGHVGAGDSEATHHHIKHGIAALAVASAAFAYAWFATGPAANRSQDASGLR